MSAGVAIEIATEVAAEAAVEITAGLGYCL